MFKRKQQPEPLIIPEYMSETFDSKLDWVLKSNAAIRLWDEAALRDYDILKEDLKKLFSIEAKGTQS